MNGSYLYMGNPDLKPQTSDYFSLGVEYSWKGFYFNVSGYYNTLNNMITLVTIPNYQAPAEYQVAYELKKTRQYQNMEDAKTYGVDVSLRYAHKEWNAGIGYSYLDNSAHVYDTNKDILKKVTIDGTAHHKANAYVTWNHAFGDFYRLGVGVYGRMSTKRYYQTDGDGKGYQIWRINTTHDFGKSKTMSYRLEAGVDNIFDYVDTTPHGRHLGTTTPGRTIYASLTIKFSKGKKTNSKFNSNMSNSEDD
jgi:outer membrane receptor for ferrienterochelin and colicins